VENNRNVVEALKNVASTSPEDQARVRDHAPSFNDAAAWNQTYIRYCRRLVPGTVDNEDYKAYLDGKAPLESVKDPKEREFALALHTV